MKDNLVIFWFRRDLRLEDNVALYHALNAGLPVLPIFIFDDNILDLLEDKKDARVSYIHQCLFHLNSQLKKNESALKVLKGDPFQVFSELIKEYKVKAVYANRDYETYAMDRDEGIAGLLRKEGIGFHDFKDQVIFEKNEITKNDGLPYTVYTPYMKRWKLALREKDTESFPSESLRHNFLKWSGEVIYSLEALNFEKSEIEVPAMNVSKEVLLRYKERRDIPALRATTQLSVHLRFGTVSPRELVRLFKEKSETLLNELIWREFFMQILWHFPHVAKASFRKAYDGIKWRNNEEEFQRWCEGRTGFPLVDAGMRELNQTGLMHNRVRMVVASFLVKDLLIDWRWGEAYFANKLLDYELSSNNGNWQWAAGTGCDAAPYFRIFNPEEQARKFDPDALYIKKWIPEYGTVDYAKPMVDHKMARERTLKAYKDALA